MTRSLDPLQELAHTLQAAFIALEQANSQIDQDRSTLLHRIQQLETNLTSDIPPVAGPASFTSDKGLANQGSEIQELEAQITELQRQLTASEARHAFSEHQHTQSHQSQDSDLAQALMRAEQAENRYAELQADIEIRIDSAEQLANERIADMQTQMIAELERRETLYQQSLEEKEDDLSRAHIQLQEKELAVSQMQEQAEMWQANSQSLETDMSSMGQELTHLQQQAAQSDQEKQYHQSELQDLQTTLENTQKQLSANERLSADQTLEIQSLKIETDKLKEWREKAMRKMFKAGLIKRP